MIERFTTEQLNTMSQEELIKFFCDDIAREFPRFKAGTYKIKHCLEDVRSQIRTKHDGDFVGVWHSGKVVVLIKDFFKDDIKTASNARTKRKLEPNDPELFADFLNYL